MTKLLITALEAAIALLIEWHDSDGEPVAYRFDLTDHPRVAPLYAALAAAKGPERGNVVANSSREELERAGYLHSAAAKGQS